jgi:hypothetical protein
MRARIPISLLSSNAAISAFNVIDARYFGTV